MRLHDWASTALLAVVVNPHSSLGAQPTSLNRPPTANAYSDKNGFFTFVPPQGWKRKDYPSDPRSKVEFVHPTNEAVHIVIIVATAPPHMTDSTFVDLIKNDMETTKARIGLPVLVTTKPGEFAGHVAAYVRSSLLGGGLEQELTLFLANNVFFNISFQAPDERLLEANRNVVTDSLSTLVFRGTLNKATAREHQVARYLRLAKLYSDVNNFDGAKAYLSDALQAYPDDARLQRASQLIAQGKTIPLDLDPARDATRPAAP